MATFLHQPYSHSDSNRLWIGTELLTQLVPRQPSWSANDRVEVVNLHAAVDIQLDCHVLVVDDRRDIRFLTNNILTAAGAFIEEAEDGQLALAAFHASQDHGPAFDIVILDMQMPRLDGYEAARAIRSLGFAGPIIALTADAMQGDMSKCMEVGCDDYLSKPIDADRLLRLVKKITSS